jgi:crossover junction endodeoxyribonuclease RuvC
MTIIIKTKNNFWRTIELIDTHHPDDLRSKLLFGKNVQSMLKLGRARVAIAGSKRYPITEYEPKKIKMAITETECQ